VPGSKDDVKPAEAMRDRWPPVKLILTSGSSRPRIDRLSEGTPFILKPCAENNLIETLHSSLVKVLISWGSLSTSDGAIRHQA
jgi:hypothetical protein